MRLSSVRPRAIRTLDKAVKMIAEGADIYVRHGSSVSEFT